MQPPNSFFLLRSLPPPSAMNEAEAQEATESEQSPEFPEPRGRGRDDNLIPSNSPQTHSSTPSPLPISPHQPTNTTEPANTPTNHKSIALESASDFTQQPPPLLSSIAPVPFESTSDVPQQPPPFLSESSVPSTNVQTQEVPSTNVQTQEVPSTNVQTQETALTVSTAQSGAESGAADQLPDGWDSAFDETQACSSSLFVCAQNRCLNEPE